MQRLLHNLRRNLPMMNSLSSRRRVHPQPSHQDTQGFPPHIALNNTVFPSDRKIGFAEGNGHSRNKLCYETEEFLLSSRLMQRGLLEGSLCDDTLRSLQIGKGT